MKRPGSFAWWVAVLRSFYRQSPNKWQCRSCLSWSQKGPWWATVPFAVRHLRMCHLRPHDGAAPSTGAYR